VSVQSGLICVSSPSKPVIPIGVTQRLRCLPEFHPLTPSLPDLLFLKKTQAPLMTGLKYPLQAFFRQSQRNSSYLPSTSASNNQTADLPLLSTPGGHRTGLLLHPHTLTDLCAVPSVRTSQAPEGQQGALQRPGGTPTASTVPPTPLCLVPHLHRTHSHPHAA